MLGRASLTALSLVALGCGGNDPTSKVARACDKIVSLCDSEPVHECRQGLTFDPADGISRETHDKFLDCALASTTCSEIGVCLVETLDTEREVEKKKRSRRRDRSARAEDPLPPQCARVDELCSADESLVRRSCARMVRNISSDTKNLVKLAACFEQAKNCYALDNCVDDLWLELN